MGPSSLAFDFGRISRRSAYPFWMDGSFGRSIIFFRRLALKVRIKGDTNGTAFRKFACEPVGLLARVADRLALLEHRDQECRRISHAAAGRDPKGIHIFMDSQR